MSRFDTSGLDNLITQMYQMGEQAGDVADDMLMSSAEIVKKCWKRAALQAGHKITGGLIDSIGYPRKPKGIKGIKTIDIYPQGNSPTAKEKGGKPARYAAIAFRIHYGTSKHPGSRFIDNADAMSAKPVEENMKKKWNNFLAKKGMI